MAEYVKATLAELPADASVPVGSRGWVTVGDKIYEWDGDSWVLKSIGGSALVVPGIGSAQTFTRFYDLSTTFSATTHYEEFTAADNILMINVTAYTATAQARQSDEYCRVLCDAPDPLTASLMLALTGGVGLNMGWETLGPTERYTRVFTRYLTSLALLPINEAQKVMVTFIKGGA